MRGFAQMPLPFRRSMKRLLILSAVPLMLRVVVASAAEKVDFNYDIRPLISSKCYHCHGPDEKARKAKLRLDMRDDAIKEHESGVTIVPGDAQKSELIHRITTKDRDEVMPPPKEEHALSAHEIDLFRRWINEGAEYKPHWSFVKPVRPRVPEINAAGKNLVRYPIDAFVLTKMALYDLKPSPEADRYTLIRRVSLDLTGLPPTPEETDAFVNDASADAYEKVVDRLLASPAYGERWAKMWLDLARYADSSGYGSDFVRLNVWPYRDWVINAFNRNLPFDQFTVEQIAGDLLPNPTTEQLVATEFNRNTMTNFEGGTIPEEFRVAAVKDRLSTTGEVWMGLTIGCAQCHSHKFDPISQTDYYRFFGVFNQSEDANRRDDEPTMALPTPEQTAKTAQLKEEIAAIEKSNSRRRHRRNSKRKRRLGKRRRPKRSIGSRSRRLRSRPKARRLLRRCRMVRSSPTAKCRRPIPTPFACRPICTASPLFASSSCPTTLSQRTAPAARTTATPRSRISALRSCRQIRKSARAFCAREPARNEEAPCPGGGPDFQQWRERCAQRNGQTIEHRLWRRSQARHRWQNRRRFFQGPIGVAHGHAKGSVVGG